MIGMAVRLYADLIDMSDDTSIRLILESEVAADARYDLAKPLDSL